MKKRKQQSPFSATAYSKKNPNKAKMIKQAVKKGLEQYEETFRRLATT